MGRGDEVKERVVAMKAPTERLPYLDVETGCESGMFTNSDGMTDWILHSVGRPYTLNEDTMGAKSDDSDRLSRRRPCLLYAPSSEHCDS